MTYGVFPAPTGPAGPPGPPGPAGFGAYSIAQANIGTLFPHTTWEVLGADPYEITDSGTATRTFRCVAMAPSGLIVQVRLTDLSAPGGQQLCIVSTSAIVPTQLFATFVPIDATRRTYAVEIRLTDGVPQVNQRGYCYGSIIEVT